uniref:AAA-like domain-containing protein n=1 Tax=Desertifilum tharense IPPAS B-1220 TaxID=1781255 RepID=A0ACD5GWB9_9CYAN
MLLSSHSTYQVGGSLHSSDPTYVERAADRELFDALLQGEFCYVFNSRQMGKSSLRVKTAERLQQVGVRCATIDLSGIGTQQITVEQWYAAIAGFLSKRFSLPINISQWWRSQTHLSSVARLGELVDKVLLVEIQQPIAIFIDEIDTILSLQFSTDDFFALIRAFYNYRADNPTYSRLTFALFGVTTPSDLISDKTRTPFNIGRAIALQGFQPEDATPLLKGLEKYYLNAPDVLNRIFDWTGGQPFLTQKLCQLVLYQIGEETSVNLSQGQIDQIVQTCILENWEAQDEPEHLKTIRDRLLFDEQKAGRILGLYQQVLETRVLANDSPTQTALLLSGLVEKYSGYLRIKNPIYQTVFNREWLAQQLDALRPYSQLFNAWLASQCQDESRLLRGQALQEVLDWTQRQSLSDLDYRYLAASQEMERREVQKTLEMERLREAEVRLALEQKSAQRQRQLLKLLSVALAATAGLGE